MGIKRRDVLVGAGCGVVGGLIGANLPGGGSEQGVPDMALNVMDYRELARNRLPKMVFDFMEGGASNERALAHNRAVFDRINLRPRRLKNIAERNQSIELFGRKQAAPFMIAPTGMNGILWPDGDLALVKAAQEAGLPFALSTAASSSIEEVAAVSTGDRWFQLYVSDRGVSQTLVERAQAAGYSTLVLTSDVAINGLRERDVRNGFSLPVKYSLGTLWDGMTHPRWSLDLVTHGMPQMGNFVSKQATDTNKQATMMSRSMDATFDWEALQWLRKLWKGTLLVKGILNADDAVRCVAEGADGVILSNHGGRQLGDAIAPLQVLAETRSKITQPILIDSGYRHGADIVKALALGANSVLLGRATLYGLAAKGQAGVADVIKIMKNEIDNTLAQIECPNVRDLTPDWAHNWLDVLVPMLQILLILVMFGLPGAQGVIEAVNNTEMARYMFTDTEELPVDGQYDDHSTAVSLFVKGVEVDASIMNEIFAERQVDFFVRNTRYYSAEYLQQLDLTYVGAVEGYEVYRCAKE